MKMTLRSNTISSFMQACKQANFKKAETIFRKCKPADRLKVSNLIVDTENKRSVLHFFARCGCVDAVKACLSVGADKNIKDRNGWTPLLTALGFKRFDVAAVLILSGANVNIPENHGITPIAFVSEYGELHLVDLLIQAGADPNICGTEGSYPLVRATIEGHNEVVKKLVECGANIDAVDLDDGTALITSIIHGHEDVAKTLIEMGANVNTKNRHGFTALFAAVMYKRYLSMEILLVNNADTNLKNDEGLSPLGMAVMLGYKKIVITLLKRSAKMSRNPHNENFPPASCAVLQGNLEIIQILLAFHYDFTCRSDIFDALTVAAKEGKYKITETLLALQGAYPTKYSVKSSDFSPLHHAACSGKTDVIKLLVAAGADKNLTNLYDMKPIDCARNCNQKQAEIILSDDSFPSESYILQMQQRFVEIRDYIDELRKTLIDQ